MTLGLYGLSMQAQIISEAQTCTFWPGFAVINLFIHAQLSQLSIVFQGRIIFIKLPFIIKTFVLSIFEWPLKTGVTVCCLSFA